MICYLKLELRLLLIQNFSVNTKKLSLKNYIAEIEMINIFDVAKYTLDGVGGNVSAMKLQKLCYYSQAWNLAWEDVPLFPEDFWRLDQGPVCRELFDWHRGLFYVNSDIPMDEQLSGNELSATELRNIDQIIENYGEYSGAQLIESTHAEDPWKNTPKDEIIDKEIIKSYYKSLIS
jgi:uncharacterized phage-associated protein